jgi:hypothetical protein
MQRHLLALTVVAVLAAVLTVPAGGRDSVPFKSSDLGGFQIAGWCGLGIVLTDDWGSGTGTHIGKYTFVATECVNLATFAVTDGSWTITAANGDTVSGEYAGQAAPAPGSACDITYDVEGPVTGGTGRFEGATGHLRWEGFANLCTRVLGDEISGWISSVGSTK